MHRWIATSSPKSNNESMQEPSHYTSRKPQLHGSDLTSMKVWNRNTTIDILQFVLVAKRVSFIVLAHA
ncbi:hypothetical protein JHK82_021098 [Glycine max]|nr:hypothetical protein JHK87_020999 [Glycine soja]KAG5136367.1 hypothetical protein JHK82_021098 [Glycine max]KHN47993.1 hypothetical protein glysoja_015463 [Glycine soja]